MSTDDTHEHHEAGRGLRSSRRTGRFALASITMLVLGGVLLTAGASAAPSTDVPPVVTLIPGDPPLSADAVVLKPVGYWEDVFLESWAYEYENTLPASRMADSWEQYGLAYDVDGNTAMFRATGSTRYLDRALEYVDNVVATARVSSSLPTSQYRDRFRGWVSARVGLDEVPLYESYLWRYVTTMLRVMRDTPAIYDDPVYRARYDRLLAFAEVHIFDKWYTRGADDNIYRGRTHMAAHWATIALNLSLITTDADRRTRSREVVDNIDQRLPNYDVGLRDQLRQNPANPSAYFWNDVWRTFRRPGQDVSHGNGVISYVVEAADRGEHWTDADMAGFSALLTKVIWPGGHTYRDYVDGTGTGYGWFSDGFVNLGRYDAAVQLRLEEHAVVNAQFAANMALNAKLLS